MAGHRCLIRSLLASILSITVSGSQLSVVPKLAEGASDDAPSISPPMQTPSWIPGVGPPKFGHCVRILSIDGGGIRGIIPALVLADLEKRTGKPIADLFDLIVGTSTGGILALGLSKPAPGSPGVPQYRAKQLVELYSDEGRNIFPTTIVRLVAGPKYSPVGLERVLTKYFGDTKLGEAVTNVRIPAYDIEERRHFFFTSSSIGAHLSMRQVALAATPAPTYFPPVKVPMMPVDRPKGYVVLVDGGIFSNNPAPYALESAPAIRPGSRDILLISLGTGAPRIEIPFEEAKHWGLVAWAGPLINIMFSDPGVEEALHHILPPDSYFRFQPQLGNMAGNLDDASPTTVEALKRLAQQLVRDGAQALSVVTFRLGLPRSPDCPPRITSNVGRP